MSVVFQLAPPAFVTLLVAAWLGPAAWMSRDAGQRLRHPRRAVLAFAGGALFPVLAPFTWLLLRPPETLEEREERELTRRHLERLLEPGERCLVCRTPVQPEFVCCPGCATELRSRCRSCARPLELTWSVCPYCAEGVREAAPRLHLTA